MELVVEKGGYCRKDLQDIKRYTITVSVRGTEVQTGKSEPKITVTTRNQLNRLNVKETIEIEKKS